jgi:hypothetical protein
MAGKFGKENSRLALRTHETSWNGTRPKHECFNACFKTGQKENEKWPKPLKTLEASTGIEPVYTDLQSGNFR